MIGKMNPLVQDHLAKVLSLALSFSFSFSFFLSLPLLTDISDTYISQKSQKYQDIKTINLEGDMSLVP